MKNEKANLLAGAQVTLSRGISIDQAVRLTEQWQEGEAHTGTYGWIAVSPQFIDPNPPVVLDLRLPDISGFDAVRRLKDHKETGTIPVVAVTAFAMVGDESKALTSGCDAYLAKPILLRDFLNLVERFIGAAGGPQ